MMSKMISKRTALLCAIFLLAYTFQVQAQDHRTLQGALKYFQDGIYYCYIPPLQEPTYGSSHSSDDSRYGDLRPGEFLIINKSSSKLVFDLKNGVNSNYVRFEIDPNGRSTFRNATHIRLRTNNGKFVVRIVEAGIRYQIYWQYDVERWDVKAISSK